LLPIKARINYEYQVDVLRDKYKMNNKDIFNELIKKCYLSIKDCGLSGISKRRNTIYFKKDANYALINFQKSMSSAATETRFTINIGIASRVIYEFNEEEINVPTIVDCHYAQRLGFLIPTIKSDKWWLINEDTNANNLYLEISDYINRFALPVKDKYSHDDGLIDLWLSGLSPGLGEFQRLLNLSILLKAKGKNKILDQVIKELRESATDKYFAHMVERHIKELSNIKS
jgi:hypothetical protein